MAFVIFWSAVFAVISFVLGIIFKALASALYGMVSSFVSIFNIGLCIVTVIIAINALCMIIEGIVNKSLFKVILIFIGIIIVVGLFCYLGSWIYDVIMEAVICLIEIIAVILEWLAATCENAYARSLKAIVNRLDKC